MSMNEPLLPDTYAVFDLEFLFDREAHARFMEGENDQSRTKCDGPSGMSSLRR